MNMAEGKTAFGHDGFDARYGEISIRYLTRSACENVAYST